MLLLDGRYGAGGSLQRNFQTCKDCPDYYPGTEPDASTSPLPSSDKEWEGRLTLEDEGTWNGGFCKTLSITNPAAKTATDVTITLTTKNCQITTLWGVRIQSTTQGRVILVPDREIRIKPGTVGCGNASLS